MEKTKEFKQILSTRKNVLKICFIIFCIAFIISAIIFTIVAIMTKEQYYFSDFAETLAYCRAYNPYDESSLIVTIYPPIAFLLFYGFSLICKQPLDQYVNGQISLAKLSYNPKFLLAFFLYYAITLALYMLVIAKMSKLKGKELVYLLGIIFCCGPLVYGFIRANVILSVGLFVLIFFWLYKSDKRWKREISLFFLALAISIKIFPVFIAMYFIKDRKWKDLIKTAIYTIILVFLPFVFIKGNIIQNILAVIKRGGEFSGDDSRIIQLENVSLTGTIARILWFVSLSNRWFDSIVVAKFISKVFIVIMVITSLTAMFLSKNSTKNMQVMALPILTYILFNNVNYSYAIITLLAPFIYFLLNYETFNAKDRKFYLVVYMIIMFAPLYMFHFIYSVNISLLALYIKAMIDIINELKTDKKDKMKAINLDEDKSTTV